MKKKIDYIQLTADAVSTDYETVKLKMEAMNEQYGLTFKEYYENAFYEMTETKQVRKAKSLQNKKERRENAIIQIVEETGCSRKEIREKIREINEKGIFKIVTAQYAKFELYKMTEAQIDDTLRLLARRDQLKERLLEDFRKIDEGSLCYEEIRPMTEEFYQIIGTLLPEKYKEKLTTPYRPDLTEKPCDRDKIAVDIEAAKFLLGFTIEEYYTFHFWEKNLEEKRTFLTTKERNEILNILNTQESQDILKNKRKCYEILGKYYDRKQVMIEKNEDAAALARLCRWRREFVKKPFSESFGRGVELVKVDRKTDYKHLTESLLEECGKFVAEERIVQHPVMRKLNPDSVNTVRLETYYDGETIQFVSGFLRIGQKDSFVDNGGAGGMAVAIDLATGRVISDGCDEMGRNYKSHPYTGVELCGFQLPHWKKALALGRKVADKIPGASYIGWDLAYTKKRKWVIVEGNGTPQYIFNQGTLGRGLKKELIEQIKDRI